MLKLALVLLLSQCASATKFPSGAWVITGHEARNGQLALIPGQEYRVYAAYTSTASSDYALNIKLKHQNGQISIWELTIPMKDTNYVLSSENILVPPFSLVDENPKPATGFAPAYPYTLYFVPKSIPAWPVINAQYAKNVDSSVSKMSTAGVTVLSAELNFQISNIDVASFGSVLVSNVGHDAPLVENMVMTVTPAKAGSAVVISGPIATISSGNQQPGTFRFDVAKSAAWSGSLPPNAATAFLSNGWLNTQESYDMEYNQDYTRTRYYDFGRDTEITFSSTLGNFYPTKGDQATLTCKRNDNKEIAYNCSALGTKQTTGYCKVVTFQLSTTQMPQPNFRIIVESGAAASSFIVLILSLIFAL